MRQYCLRVIFKRQVLLTKQSLQPSCKPMHRPNFCIYRINKMRYNARMRMPPDHLELLIFETALLCECRNIAYSHCRYIA